MSDALLADLTLLKPGVPITHQGITLIPIFAPQGRVSNIAIAGNDLVVSELPTPTVPQLQVHNPTDTEVLIPAGRILSGGRQTRVVNVSIVVPAGATILIPVSCVEEGRWSGIGRFADSRRVASRRVRQTKARSVKRNIDRYKSKASAQSEVWSTISYELSSRGVDADAQLFLEVDTALDRRTDRMEVVRKFVADGVQAGQVGVAIAHGEKILGIEVFPSTEALQGTWEAIVRAAVIDADEFSIQPESADATRGVAALERFLAEVAATEGTVSDGVGRGTEVHVETPAYVAHGLRVDGELVYCNAFAD